MADGPRVLIVGTSLLPGVVPSDKQFVNDLVAALPRDIQPAVWTMNESSPQKTRVVFGRREVPYTSINRTGHRPWRADGERLIRHNHGEVRSLVEVGTTLAVASFGSLREAIETHQASIVHFWDDYGPVIPLLRRLYPRLNMTCLKASTRIRSRHSLLYSLRIRMGLISADRVIAFSNSCRENLIKLGVRRDIVVIPWGVNRPEALTEEQVRSIRAEHGCLVDDVLVIASPRRLDATLKPAVEAAVQARSVNSRLRFIFCIKPTMWQDDYRGLESGGVTVMPSPPEFYDLLASADALFAPQRHIMTTNLPPLLWLEAMVRGTPVVTMDNPGVEETIEDGVSGMIYDRIDSASVALCRLTDHVSLKRIQASARKVAGAKYCIDTIAESYAAVWRSFEFAGNCMVSRESSCSKAVEDTRSSVSPGVDCL